MLVMGSIVTKPLSSLGFISPLIPVVLNLFILLNVTGVFDLFSRSKFWNIFYTTGFTLGLVFFTVLLSNFLSLITIVLYFTAIALILFRLINKVKRKIEKHLRITLFHTSGINSDKKIKK